MTPTNHPATPASTPARGARYSNLALTAVAVLLGLNLLRPDFASTALAQSGGGESLTSAAEQRKQMIAQLTSIEKRLERLESQIAKGIRISDMPELKLPADVREAMKSSARQDKPEKPAK